jgi:hypothetical protein
MPNNPVLFFPFRHQNLDTKKILLISVCYAFELCSRPWAPCISLYITKKWNSISKKKSFCFLCKYGGFFCCIETRLQNSNRLFSCNLLTEMVRKKPRSREKETASEKKPLLTCFHFAISSPATVGVQKVHARTKNKTTRNPELMHVLCT